MYNLSERITLLMILRGVYMNKINKGISFLNPVRVEEKYLKKCAEYAIEHGIKHFGLFSKRTAGFLTI